MVCESCSGASQTGAAVIVFWLCQKVISPCGWRYCGSSDKPHRKWNRYCTVMWLAGWPAMKACCVLLAFFEISVAFSKLLLFVIYECLGSFPLSLFLLLAFLGVFMALGKFSWTFFGFIHKTL
jgi:hypothetical protein